MDPAVVQVVHVDPQLVADELAHVDVEHPPVVGQRDMHVGPLPEQRAHQRGGYVGQPPRLGPQDVAHIAHPLRQIGDLRSDDQNPRFAFSPVSSA